VGTTVEVHRFLKEELMEDRPAFLDTSLPLQDRINDLVSRMTLEEKVSQMLYDAPAIERLGIPAYNWWNECLHGVARAGIATVFPQAIGLAATFNTDLMSQVSTAISDEARAKHHEALRRGIRIIYSGLTYWSPNVNIFRDPRWGRGQETYGECPYLTARMGVAFVKGLQQDEGDRSGYFKLVATAKHYAVHSGPESERHTFDARISDIDLWQTYLPAFEALMVEAQAYSIMGAYNRLNGEACCASPTLLRKILRERWAFDGYVVSDCGAIDDIYATHKVVDTAEEASALAVKAGCDLNCGATYPSLVQAVQQGLIDETTLDTSVRRLFTARFRLGMFDPPEMVPYAQIPYSVNDSPDHRALALRAARESIVLLKNEDHVLPLSKDVGSIAVIGPDADDLMTLLGNYCGTASRATTVLEGLRAAVSPKTRVSYARGCDVAEGVPALQPIPSVYLRPAHADAGQSGLSATYYDNAASAGLPALHRVDPMVNFMWKGVSPLSGELGDPFAAHWTGSLVAPVSGKYRLGVKGFSHYSLYLEGQLLVDFASEHHAVTRTAEVELVAGRLYDLHLDFASRGLDPMVQLLWSQPGCDPLGEALAAAEDADVIVAALGLTPDLEGEEMPVHVPGFAGGDRTDLALPRPQQELLERLYALGKPVVLVLLGGSAISIPWAAEHIPAILAAWYPGEEGGRAVADVLLGNYNPAGRLPVTVYRSVHDLPPFNDYAMEGHTYRYFRGQPLYPFGYGLSYNTYAYDNLQVSGKTIAPGDGLTVSVEVTNLGRYEGDEVVQVYLSDTEASAPVPIRQLVGFKRIHLEAGETRTVSLTVPGKAFALVDAQGRRIIEPGAFIVAVGGGQPTADALLGAEGCTPVATIAVVGAATEI
jgi:beta-glucosidase